MDRCVSVHTSTAGMIRSLWVPLATGITFVISVFVDDHFSFNGRSQQGVWGISCTAASIASSCMNWGKPWYKSGAQHNQSLYILGLDYIIEEANLFYQSNLIPQEFSILTTLFEHLGSVSRVFMVLLPPCYALFTGITSLSVEPNSEVFSLMNLFKWL